MGQALYIDQYYGLRQTQKTLGNFMTDEERALWLEHNAYWALYTADRYVWCYSERMNWWTDQDVPPGAEEAIRRAKAAVDLGAAFAGDLAPVIAASQAKLDADPKKSP